MPNIKTIQEIQYIWNLKTEKKKTNVQKKRSGLWLPEAREWGRGKGGLGGRWSKGTNFQL